MPSPNKTEENQQSQQEVKKPAILSLIALGIVYGDIGTSPLYALRECFQEQHALEVSGANILGLLSLVFWALILIISVKYLVFILQADNDGEGGILALTSLVTSVKKPTGKGSGLILAMGLLGSALLYADGMITPSISVLSAVEGLEVATPLFRPYLQVITIGILVGLFLFQSRGTSGVGLIFGPVMLLWFITLAVLGLVHILTAPEVLWAVNPTHAIGFLLGNGFGGFLALGTVFLVVTGGEALYADIGHFGTQPIRLGWYSLVLPALLINYFGQGAFLLDHPKDVVNPFYRMAPDWALYPLVVLATVATVIASQAVITGAFSLTLQAVQFGFCPRMTIRHTSHEQAGQVYIPVVNWALMIACICLVLGFQTSSNLAAAYGVAITITMVITSVLFFFLVRKSWNWSLPVAVIVSGLFLIVDLSFLGANLPKVTHGGWFPLVVAVVLYGFMSTWMAGRQLLAERLNENSVPLELFLAQLMDEGPVRVPGMAIFLTGNPIGTPPALQHNVTHNKVLHEHVVLLTVSTADVPHVRVAHRTQIEEVGEGVYRVGLTYGFMDTPNVPLALLTIEHEKLDFQRLDVSYFVGREDLLATHRPGIGIWRERLFAWMSRNSQKATDYYQLPPEQVMEVGGQIEL